MTSTAWTAEAQLPEGFVVRGEALRRQAPRPGLFAGPGDAARDAVLAALASGALKLEWRPCPLCGQRSFSRVADEERHRLPHGTVLCDGCGFCLTNPVLDAASMATFYSVFYRALYAQGVELLDFYKKQAKKGRSLRAFLAAHGLDGAFGHVAEVGAGAGGVLHPFKAAGAQTVGVDFDEDYLAFGRAGGMALLSGGVDAVPEDFVPDLVIYRHVLEHIVDPVAEMKTVFRRWPKALLYVEVPGLLNLRFYGFDLALYLQNAHTSNFTAESLVRTIELAGGRALVADETVRCLATAQGEWRIAEAERAPSREGAAENRGTDLRAYLAACDALAGSRWLREHLAPLSADPRIL